jgi:hypothetical protein
VAFSVSHAGAVKQQGINLHLYDEYIAGTFWSLYNCSAELTNGRDVDDFASEVGVAALNKGLSRDSDDPRSTYAKTRQTIDFFATESATNCRFDMQAAPPRL